MNEVILTQRLAEVVGEMKLDAIIDAEPVILALLQTAAIQHDYVNRWQAYETLKAASAQFVGWNADNPALNTSWAYMRVMEALDLLLPTPEIEFITPELADREEALQRLRDAVLLIPLRPRPGSEEEPQARTIPEMLEHIQMQLQAEVAIKPERDAMAQHLRDSVKALSLRLRLQRAADLER